jgi:hypothetical protein
MGIMVLHIAGCPNLGLARARLTEALDRLGLAATVAERVVADADEAVTLGFGGSPTLLVDGRDPFPAAGPAGLACRLYPSPSGPQGAPTVDALVEALRSCTAHRVRRA